MPLQELAMHSKALNLLMAPLDDFSDTLKKVTPVHSFGRDLRSSIKAIVKVLEWAAPIVAKLGSIIGKD
jgi:hypothetical protein